MKKKESLDINYWDEFVMTFSNNKSLFSSKKIERFIVFWTFLILSIVYISINIYTMEAMDFVEVAALFLVYGGYNSLMTLRDRKIDKNQSEATSDDGIQI